jgi:hypothetical protein
MDITNVRFAFYDTYTISHLWIDGVDTGLFVLEDKVREKPGVPVEQWKIAGQTAIPVGTYKITVTMSARFGRLLPLFHEVPGFSSIRAHAGNKSSNTEGCLLMGKTWKSGDFIGQSRDAESWLLQRVQGALAANEEVTWTVAGLP